MSTVRKLRILNAILLAVCGGMGYALWEKHRAPEFADAGLALARQVQPMRFEKTPIEECFDRLAQSVGAGLNVDWSHLMRNGVFKDTPVAATIESTQLRDALRRVLTSLPNGMLRSDVDIGERDGVVFVGEEVPHPEVVRGYDIAWIRRVCASQYFPKTPPPVTNSGGGGGGSGGNGGGSGLGQNLFARPPNPDPVMESVIELLTLGLIHDDPVGRAHWITPIGDRLLVRDTIENQIAIAQRLNELHRALLTPEEPKPVGGTRHEDDAARHRMLPSLRFENEPLNQALVRLGAAAQMPIHVYWDRLALFSDLRPDTRVTFNASGMRLDRALTELLAKLNGDANPMRQVDWFVENQVIVIGLAVELYRSRETRAYVVRDLVPNPAQLIADAASSDAGDSPEMIFVHQVAMHADLPSSAKLTYWNGALLVTCRPEHHDMIRNVLSEMRSALKR